MPRERWQMSAVAEADSRLAMQLAISFLAPAGERSSRQRASKRTCPLHIFLSFFFSVSINEQPSPAALIASFFFSNYLTQCRFALRKRALLVRLTS